MRINDDGRVVWSASDLKGAAECEFAWVRLLDARLGRIAVVEEPDDPTLKRAGLLGYVHEERQLETYRARFAGGVAEITETKTWDAAAMASAVAETEAALRGGADVVYQAAFAAHDFVGFADFLFRDPDGRYVVQDTKLARRAKVTALMQLAAYADQLDRLGIPRADRVELLLGDGTVSAHRVDDLLPVFLLRRARLRAMIASQRPELAAEGPVIAWGDPAVTACGRCATCTIEVEASRDLLLVAGMRPTQRRRLAAAGIPTIEALASAGEPGSHAGATVEGVSPDAFTSLRTQARLQIESERRTAEGATAPVFEVVLPAALAAVPAADPGDLFFDFEGDPLYTEEQTGLWNLDYLFGWVDDAEQYGALWAHSFEEEKRALQRFLAFVGERRRQHPALHIYHYAPYEPTHLLAMAARYGVGEAEVDTLLREGVFVDLYPIVRRALRVGSPSYSIKKLEPLYMGDDVRTSEVQKGDESIVQFVQASELRANGEPEAAQRIFDDIAEYNRDDCVSTLRLRDWLSALAAQFHVRAIDDGEPDSRPYQPSARSVALGERADALRAARLETGAGERSADERAENERAENERAADEQAMRLAGAAIDYYPREAKSFWAMHFLRLREPISLWEDARDVVRVDAASTELLRDWHRDDGQRTDRRHLLIRGTFAPGTRLTPDTSPYLLYELPTPFPFTASPRWIHGDHRCRVLEVLDDGVIVEESAIESFTWSELPVAITPTAPPPAGNQQVAIEAWADAVLDAWPAFPRDPATDILRRRPPRTRGGALAPVVGTEYVAAITDSLLDLDHSYLAVQGPPGTGKTYVGSHVIARLVKEQRWRIGVVSQSHAVVENMLDRVVQAGVKPELVGKAPKSQDEPGSHGYVSLAKNGVAAFAAERAESGFVIGGTAWDFSHEGRLARGGLDLLVIDEAGQFSLASTIAVSLVAPRLLLLGDPQQLPQVSQGTHPEPVDTSALGWVIGDHDVLPDPFGYFLAQSWRMHPAVAEPVSILSYDGRLASHACASLRHVEGLEPGLHVEPVAHGGNATESAEEAARVVAIVAGLIGSPLVEVDVDDSGTPTARPPRPLGPRDIIVVTPYNAQLTCVERALADAGFPDVPVGTVDRFQGQEAAIAIVSLAASSALDAPRGIEFLLLRNRLNVAISRAKVAAFLIYSPGLLDDLPRTPEGVARLSAFARLVGATSGSWTEGSIGAVGGGVRGAGAFGSGISAGGVFGGGDGILTGLPAGLTPAVAP
ncbi:MAG TPA: TM0106 family RecB-like putative nuclease [Microbacterium sp.]|uniref:TM0106 family RecB-like putative nuclease n=1 Tax=Microbacterium sp. TaxID=51671 RepID=UPI002C34D99F|nr:TM0106 family RecB-like putative nuclease [Microbacterium sp.]HWI31233.1 TM0106 family RecB-like putative nuclease [Microbacterium sp.]